MKAMKLMAHNMAGNTHDIIQVILVVVGHSSPNAGVKGIKRKQFLVRYFSKQMLVLNTYKVFG
jgi:hypothetical protein